MDIGRCIDHHIINFSLQEESFPSFFLMHSHRLHKKPFDPDDLSNYRPISTLLERSHDSHANSSVFKITNITLSV